MLVWISVGLPPDFASRVAGLAGVEAVTEVAGDAIDLDSGDGRAIPLDAIAVDIDTYPGFLPEADRLLFAELAPGESLLGTTSAKLRSASPGSLLRLSTGDEVVVKGVVDDVLVGAAELITYRGNDLGVVTPRYLLVSYSGDRSRLEERIRGLIDVPVRIRAPGETPFLRHGDAVLPQAHIKELFGGFSYVPTDGRQIEPDRAWAESNIVIANVPLLGRVQCHAAILPALTGALNELASRGLGDLIDPAGFAGCWNPRRIAPAAGISRHAWGVALDINYADNVTGQGSAQDRRLVEVMEASGFGWGGEWLIPDPGHFEWVRYATP